MTWFSVGMAALPLFVAAFLWRLLRRLRRAGRPDVGAERMIAAWTVTTAATVLVAAACPDAPSWVRFVMAAPTLVAGFGFLAVRIRAHPHAVFSPATVYRFTRCRGHR